MIFFVVEYKKVVYLRIRRIPQKWGCCVRTIRINE